MDLDYNQTIEKAKLIIYEYDDFLKKTGDTVKNEEDGGHLETMRKIDLLLSKYDSDGNKIDCVVIAEKDKE